MDFPLGRQRLYQELQKPDEAFDLGAAALYIAQEEYPALDVEEYLNALDTMATEVEERRPETAYPLKMLKTINQYLFEDLGFEGNAENYYDPRNSFLNDVIERRTGIPITLSVVYLEIAKRLDFPMIGVGMPGHFLIRPMGEGMEIFVDPFHQGEIMFPEDCQERLQQIYGSPVELRPEFLESVDARQLLARMLKNLKVIYLNSGDVQKALGAVERILLIFPDDSMEQRDRGILYYHTGRWTEARADLSRYLAAEPLAQDAPVIQKLVDQMEASQDE
jgi:regulator of sirC expression with transglutaminase-like and TPR domain